MLSQLFKHNQRRRYAGEVRLLRSTVSPGTRVRLQRSDGAFSVLGEEGVPAGHKARYALVMNVRAYSHGTTEVYVQTDDCSFAGWVGVDEILPVREVPR